MAKNAAIFKMTASRFLILLGLLLCCLHQATVAEDADFASLDVQLDADLDELAPLEEIDEEITRHAEELLQEALESRSDFLKAPEQAPVPVPITEYDFRSGEIILDLNWQYVSFGYPLPNPIVIAGPPTEEDGTSEVQVKNVTPDGFYIRIWEPICRSPGHDEETTYWFAISEGYYLSDAGKKILARKQMIDGQGTAIFFPELSTVPAMLSTQQTRDFDEASHPRNLFVATNGAVIGIEGDPDDKLVSYSRMVGYVVIERGSGTLAGYKYAADQGEFYELNYAGAMFTVPPCFVAVLSRKLSQDAQYLYIENTLPQLQSVEVGRNRGCRRRRPRFASRFADFLAIEHTTAITTTTSTTTTSTTSTSTSTSAVIPDKFADLVKKFSDAFKQVGEKVAKDLDTMAKDLMLYAKPM